MRVESGFCEACLCNQGKMRHEHLEVPDLCIIRIEVRFPKGGLQVSEKLMN